MADPIPPTSHHVAASPPMLNLMTKSNICPRCVIQNTHHQVPRLHVITMKFGKRAGPTIVPLYSTCRRFDINRVDGPFAFLGGRNMEGIVVTNNVGPGGVLSLHPSLHTLSMLVHVPRGGTSSLLKTIVARTRGRNFAVLPTSACVRRRVPRPKRVTKPPPAPRR